MICHPKWMPEQSVQMVENVRCVWLLWENVNDENFNIINQHELLRRYPKAPLRRIGTSRGICG